MTSQVADVRQVIHALGKAGIRLKPLDEAAALADVDPTPATLRPWSQEDANAAMTAALDDPVRLAAVAADVAFRSSGAAQAALRLVFNTRDLRVLRLFADAAQDLDKALCKALRPVRVEVEAAEQALAALRMPRPRLMEYDADGGVIRAIPNVAKGQLRTDAAHRRDGGEAMAAVHRWEDATATYSALHGLVARPGPAPRPAARCGLPGADGAHRVPARDVGGQAPRRRRRAHGRADQAGRPVQYDTGRAVRVDRSQVSRKAPRMMTITGVLTPAQRAARRERIEAELGHPIGHPRAGRRASAGEPWRAPAAAPAARARSAETVARVRALRTPSRAERSAAIVRSARAALYVSKREQAFRERCRINNLRMRLMR